MFLKEMQSNPHEAQKQMMSDRTVCEASFAPSAEPLSVISWHHMPWHPLETFTSHQDPKLQEAVSKLIAAGIIRTG